MTWCSAGDMRISALSIRGANGCNATDIRYKSHKIYKGKPCIKGLPATYINFDDETDTLEVVCTDSLTICPIWISRCSIFRDAGQRKELSLSVPLNSDFRVFIQSAVPPAIITIRSLRLHATARAVYGILSLNKIKIGAVICSDNFLLFLLA